MTQRPLRINSLTRFVIESPKKLPGIAKLNESFLPKQCRPIKLQNVLREYILGWCPPQLQEEIITDRDAWDLSHCRLEQGLLLRLRVENRRVPSSLIQYVTRDRISKKEAKRSKALSREERRTIQKEAKEELAAICLPKIKIIEGLWHMNRSELWVFSSSSRDVHHFEGYFRETFVKSMDLEMRVVDSPAFSLLSTDDGEADLWFKKIGNALPSSFSGQAAIR